MFRDISDDQARTIVKISKAPKKTSVNRSFGTLSLTSASGQVLNYVVKSKKALVG